MLVMVFCEEKVILLMKHFQKFKLAVFPYVFSKLSQEFKNIFYK